MANESAKCGTAEKKLIPGFSTRFTRAEGEAVFFSLVHGFLTNAVFVDALGKIYKETTS